MLFITLFVGCSTPNMTRVSKLILHVPTSRERPKSGSSLRLKIEKGDPSGFVKLQLVAKNEKKIEGGPFGDMKKFPKKIFSMRFLNSVTVPKNVHRGEAVLRNT